MLFLRLCIEKVVHHRDDDGHACISVTCVVSGKMANLDSDAAHVAENIASLQAEHLGDVVEPYAVCIAMDEKHRRFVALSLSAPTSSGFDSAARRCLTNFGKSFGVGLSFLYFVSMGEPLNASAVRCGKASPASLTQPSWRIAAEMLTTLRTFSGCRMAHFMATPPPML